MAGGGIKVNNTTIIGGADGITPLFMIESGHLFISYNNGQPGSWASLGRVVGADGVDGKDGKTGAKLVEQVLVEQNENGNTYKQTFDDGTVAVFVAPRGPQGQDGEPAQIVQTTGDSKTAVMSQKATTEQLNKKIQLYKHTLTDMEGVKQFIIITTGASELLYPSSGHIRIPAGQQLIKIFRIKSETVNGGYGDLCLYRSMNFITYGFEDIYEVRTINSANTIVGESVSNIFPNGLIDTVTEVQGA